MRTHQMTKPMRLATAACLLVAGCGADSPATFDQSISPVTTVAESELNSYSMTYTSTCGENAMITFKPVTVRVLDDTVVSHDGPGDPFMPLTVDRINDIIGEAADAVTLEVEYGEFGQPMEVEIDFTAVGEDDEFCVTVNEFALVDT